MVQKIRKNASVGGRIRQYRLLAGLTQEQMIAKLQLSGCNISRGTYAKIEAGIRNLDLFELKSIKQVLNVSYDKLFD